MITHWENLQADDIGDTVEDFLEKLNGPACITFDGHDNSRTRILVTLLHGNEPSGVMALFRWIKEQHTPAVRIACIVASVRTALQPPLFHYRTLPGIRDINRCFQPPYPDEPGQLAREIVDIIEYHQPEAIIDIHNTSGTGPAFGVAVYQDQKHEALTSLFSNQLVITHLKLGALMDISLPHCPALTIEAGGRLEQRSHEIAWEGLQQYFKQENIFSVTTDVNLLKEPTRIELSPRVSLCYAKHNNPEFDVTLKHNIDHYNFHHLTPDTLLGWVNHKGLDNFIVKGIRDDVAIDDWLRLEDNKLYSATTIKPFMITTSPVIGTEDCLFYAVKSEG